MIFRQKNKTKNTRQLTSNILIFNCFNNSGQFLIKDRKAKVLI